ncbi:hypothetical protein J6590_101621, partial [Homalodisca vitripennis]
MTLFPRTSHFDTNFLHVKPLALSALSRADPVRRTHWTGIVTLPGVTLFMSDSVPQPNLRRCH